MAYLGYPGIETEYGPDTELVLFKEWDGKVDLAIQFKFDFGEPLTADEAKMLPRKMIIKEVHPIVPDVMALPGSWLVSDRVRLLIESFEPNRHQFFPVMLDQSKINNQNASYFIFHAQNRVDAILTHLSDVIWQERKPFRKKDGTLVKGIFHIGNKDKLVANSHIIQDLHIWKGLNDFQIHTFLSEQLGNEFRAQRMTGWDLHHVREVFHNPRDINDLRRGPLWRIWRTLKSRVRKRQLGAKLLSYANFYSPCLPA